MSAAEHQLVQLRNGAHAVYVASYDEKMHPGLGPAAEAESLYVRQLKIRERMQRCDAEFVVWDVGLGAAANALTLLRLTRDLACQLRIVSFDNTTGPLEFALTHAKQLNYFDSYELAVEKLLARRNLEFTDGNRTVNWELHLADFPSLLKSFASKPRTLPSPHAIFYDAFSPAKNPAMWTLPLFENLCRQLHPSRPCSLTTYSRSTMLRVTLLLAGFFVGRGSPTGMKEETTVAANTLELIDEPLDRKWLETARRSDSAEPLQRCKYSRSRLSAENVDKLSNHMQFGSGSE